jgi:hypothetical protein
MMTRPLAAAAILVHALLAAGALQAAPPSGPHFPVEATLTEPLSFRTTPSLQGAFVIKGRNYLQAGTKLKLLDSKPAFGTAGAFCTAEAMGHKGYIRCDKPSAFKLAERSSPQQQAAPAPQQKGGSPVQKPPAAKKGRGLGQYCHDEASCKAFCQANCKLDLARWGKGVSSTCTLPAGLGGSIAPGSGELQKLPAMKFVKGASDARATADVLVALKRADDWIAASTSWPQGHTVYVKNCWRSDVADSTNECDYILKGWHLKQKWAGKTPETKADKEQKALGDRFINPPKNLGLMWPGATPHSAGIGCDIVVHDPAGKSVTDCRMTKDDTKAQAMSKALVDALTNEKVGAVRLNFEGWHFEWGGTLTGCRCKGADCNDNHWPTLCDGPQHCNKPL